MDSTVSVAGTVQPVPRVDFAPGPRYADERRCFGICSSIARTPGGRLWCGFSSGGTGEGHLNYGLVVTSDDDGASWTSPRVVFDTDGEGPIRTDHVVAWTAPGGALWLFWNQYPEGLCGPHSSLWAMTSANPDAAAPVWTPPRLIAAELNLLNKPTVLADGTWLLPTGSWQKQVASRPLLSTDQGATFVAGGELLAEPRPDFDEYMVVERRDGTLVALNRHPTSLLGCESRDRGQTWSLQQPIGMAHTNARFVFCRLPSGTWLLVKHGTLDWISTSHEAKNRNVGRSHLTAYLSRDEGATWTGGLLVEERDCSYPDAWVAADGQIYLTYERSRWHQPEILLAVFREEDVAAGRAIAAGSRFQMLVNRAGGSV